MMSGLMPAYVRPKEVSFFERRWNQAVSFVENFIDTEAERRFAATWPADLQEVARELSSGGLA